MINFYEETQEFRNNENLAKLLLNLSNSFSLWLGLNFFSMFAFKLELCSVHSIRSKVRKLFASSGVTSNVISGFGSSSEEVQSNFERAKVDNSIDVDNSVLFLMKMERTKSAPNIWTTTKDEISSNENKNKRSRFRQRKFNSSSSF